MIWVYIIIGLVVDVIVKSLQRHNKLQRFRMW